MGSETQEGRRNAGKGALDSTWLGDSCAPREMPAGNDEQGDGEYAKTLDNCHVICLFPKLRTKVARGGLPAQQCCVGAVGAIAWLRLPFSGSPLALHEELSFGAHSILPGHQ